MDKGQVQIGGMEYDYHDSYRTWNSAVNEARKLTEQDYEVKIIDSGPYEIGASIFSTGHKRFDIWKRPK